MQDVTSHPVTVADIVQAATTLHTTTASSYYVVLHNSFHLSGSGMFVDHNFKTSAQEACPVSLNSVTISSSDTTVHPRRLELFQFVVHLPCINIT